MVDITPYVRIHVKEIPLSSIVFDPAIHRGKYCVMPYNGHKKGCPNFNKCPTCPPHSPYMGDQLGIYKKFVLVYAEFAFGEYKAAMRREWLRKQPDADPSDAQLGCNLYWQRQLKNALSHRLAEMRSHSDLVLSCGSGFNNCYAMESTGMNVFQTYHNNDIPFEEHPTTKIVMSILVCKKGEMIPCQTKLV